MNSSFEYIANLEYRLKAVNAEIDAFKSGEKYVRMHTEYQKEIRFLERKNKKLRKGIADSHRETVTVRNQWFEIFEELQKECERKIAAAEKEQWKKGHSKQNASGMLHWRKL